MGMTNLFNGKCQDRKNIVPDMIVFHKVTSPYNLMIKDYPSSKKSVNFIVDTNGNIGYVIPINKAGYLCETSMNRSLMNYYGSSNNSITKSRKLDANLYIISVDIVVNYDSYKDMPSIQKDAIIWLVNYIRSTINTNYSILIPLNKNYITGYDQIIPNTSDSYMNPGDFIYEDIIKSLNVNKNVLLSSSNSSKISHVAEYGLKVGTKVTLNNIKLYKTATSPDVKKTANGVYYLYDGIMLGNRYALTNSPEYIGLTPSSTYIKGYAYVSDIIKSNPVIPQLTEDIKTSPVNREAVNYVFSSESNSNICAGRRISLNRTAIYSSPTEKEPYSHKTGTYYLYDGISNSGRYRITNSLSNIGKTPIGDYTIGFIDGNII